MQLPGVCGSACIYLALLYTAEVVFRCIDRSGASTARDSATESGPLQLSNIGHVAGLGKMDGSRFRDGLSVGIQRSPADSQQNTPRRERRGTITNCFGHSRSTGTQEAQSRKHAHSEIGVAYELCTPQTRHRVVLLLGLQAAFKSCQ